MSDQIRDGMQRMADALAPLPPDVRQRLVQQAADMAEGAKIAIDIIRNGEDDK